MLRNELTDDSRLLYADDAGKTLRSQSAKGLAEKKHAEKFPIVAMIV